MYEAKLMFVWDPASLLWATLANANRDENKHPKPFMPTDIHPLRRPGDDDSPDAERAAIIEKIRAKQRRAKLGAQHGIQSDSSGGGVS